LFTGIIESLGYVEDVRPELDNRHFCVRCNFVSELVIGQSVAHNGVCLTVTEILADSYWVTAVAETLAKTNLGKLKPGMYINLERCMPANGRFDGHIVQGHVDCVAHCSKVDVLNGSWKYTFSYQQAEYLTVQKGSICINGVSLTVVDSAAHSFSVVIIPHTFEYTNFKYIEQGMEVNLEFDIVGKYIAKIMAADAKSN
jgi:riboflavin synthase